MFEFLTSNEPSPAYITIPVYIIGGLIILTPLIWASIKLNQETTDPNPKHENTL